MGSAWKRRSAGSSYSARQSAHMAKPAIVVRGAVVGDAGHDRVPGAAGGAVDERVAVPAVGRVAQLGQAVGAGGGVGGDGRRGLAAGVADEDREARSPVGASLGARGARCWRGAAPRRARRSRKRSTAAGGASTSSSTPAASFRTNPPRPRSVASRWTCGRKPTPCTTPSPGRGPAGSVTATACSTSSLRTCQALPWASWIRGMCSERVTTTWSASPSWATRPPS